MHNNPQLRQRNIRIARFQRHDVRARQVRTHFVGLDEDLTFIPRPKLVAGAIGLLLSQCVTGGWRICFCCGANFDDDTKPAAVLIAIPISADAAAAAVSGLCAECWRARPADDIETAAVRVLQKLVPSGQFLDPPSSQADAGNDGSRR